MSELIIEVKVNAGSWVSAESLGLSVGTRTLRSFAPDELTFTCQLEAYDSTPPVEYEDALSLRVNGTVVFSGEVQAPSMAVSETGAALSVRVLGPWHQMLKVLFTRTQPRTEGATLTRLPPTLGSTFVLSGVTYKWAREDDAGAVPIEVSIPRFVSTHGLLFDPDRTSGVTYRTMLSEVLSLLEYYAASYTRRGATCPIQYSSAGITADLGGAATPRFRTFHDRSVGSLLADVCAAKPDCATWFDYTTTPPTLHMAASAAMDAETLTIGTAPLSGCDVTPRPDLQPAGVMVRWEYEPEVDWQSRGYAHPHTIDRSPADIMPHEPGVLVHSIAYEEPLIITTGLAASLMASIGVLRGSGSLALAGCDEELDAAAWRPGLALDVAGAPLLSGVSLLSQETVWDIMGRSVSVTVGYPEPLDLQAARDLRGWLVLTLQGWPWSYTALLAPPS